VNKYYKLFTATVYFVIFICCYGVFLLCDDICVLMYVCISAAELQSITASGKVFYMQTPSVSLTLFFVLVSHNCNNLVS